MAVADVESTP